MFFKKPARLFGYFNVVRQQVACKLSASIHIGTNIGAVIYNENFDIVQKVIFPGRCSPCIVDLADKLLVSSEIEIAECNVIAVPVGNPVQFPS
jgi:hypothetical protein